MENWFENEWLYTKDTGERFTKMLKETGFTSKKESDAYSFVDSIIIDHIMYLDSGIANERIKQATYPFALVPSKKEEKLKFYEELGLTNILEKALVSSEEELQILRKEFEQKLVEGLTFDELEKRIAEYEHYLDYLHKNINILQLKLQQKKESLNADKESKILKKTNPFLN